MLENLKKNLVYAFCAGIGILNFILFAFAYVESFYSYGKTDVASGISGYNTMNLFSGGFGGVMSSLVQIIIFILGLALLALGVCALLKAFGIFAQFPDKFGNFETKKLGEYGLFGLGGLNVLLLIFLIITCASNSESASEYGISYAGGVRLSAGIFIAIIFTVGAVVAFKILEKKFPANESGEKVTYQCVACGKKAKAKDKFCSQCGGAVETKIEQKIEYVCSKCKKKATAKDKFCNNCGGVIEQKVVESTVNENKEAKPTTAE